MCKIKSVRNSKGNRLKYKCSLGFSTSLWNYEISWKKKEYRRFEKYDQ